MMLLQKDRKRGSIYDFVLYALPYVVIANLVVFGIICTVLLLLGRFQIGLIWGLAFVSAVIITPLVFRAIRDSYPQLPHEHRKFVDLLLLIGVMAWGGFNVFYTAEHVITNRDPGVYATAASWLSTHESLIIKDESVISPDTPGVSTGSMGYWSYDSTGGQIYAQGQHVLPAILGALGKFVGPIDVLHFTVVLGMTALLAFYAFLRLVVRPHWALIGTAILSVSLPFLHFSRDTYTEPLALTVTFGGLAFLWLAQQNHKIIFWILAGLSLGSGALVRIDGYLALVGIAAFVGVYAVSLIRGKDKSLHARELPIFITAIAVPCLLGWIDLRLLSPHYYGDVAHLMIQEALAILGVLLIFGAVILFAKKRKNTFEKYLKNIVLYGRNVLPIGIILAMTLLTSRFLWMKGQNPTSPLFDGRSYSEVTTFWNEWYIGSALMIMGIVGMAIVAYRVFKSKKLSLLLPAFFVIAGTALVYFLKPSIFPDQLWASRRMLPVVMPGLLLCAVIGLETIEGQLRTRNNLQVRRIAIGAIGILLALTPLQISAPFLRVADSAQYAYIEGVCKNLKKSDAVVWVGHGAKNALQAARTYCGVQAYGFSSMPSETVLKSIARDAKTKNANLVFAINSDQVNDLTSRVQHSSFTPVSSASYYRVSAILNGAPRSSESVISGVSLARLNTQGEFVKI